MAKKTLVIWAVVYLVLLLGVIVWGSQTATICWDGLDVDEAKLMELCGITREDYFSEDYNPEDCPEAENAVTMIGGCEPDWLTVGIYAGAFSLFYFLASGVFLGVRKIFFKVE